MNATSAWPFSRSAEMDWRTNWEAALNALNVKWLGLAALAMLLCSSYLGQQTSPAARFWASQPFVGRAEKEWFTHLRAKMRTILHHTELMQDGYEKFNKAGRAFALPVIASAPYLILPVSLMRQLMSKGDDEINMRIVNGERLNHEYTLPANMLDDAYANGAGRQLKQKLPEITDELVDEIRVAIQEEWPQTTEWTTIKLYPVAMQIVARVANRIFAGPELCRNKDFLKHSRSWSVGVVVAGTLIKLFPEWSHPIVGRLVALPNRRHMAICQRLCQPVIKKRLDAIAQPEASKDAPNDLIQWFIEAAQESGDLDGLDPIRITDRIMTLNMVAIHTTSIAITNLILNLYGSPRVHDYVAGFRDEVDRVHPGGSTKGAWSPSAVNQLIRIDSALRETMRCNCLGDYQAIRMVTAPDGISFQNGLHVPAGVHVGFPMRALHRDPAIYASPNEFNPFRFCEKRMEQEAGMAHAGGQAATPPTKGEPSFVTPTKDFLGFGGGRHPCPGRFFAAHELKLLFAHIVENYDIEPLKETPQPFAVLGITSPSEDWEVRTRLRR